MFCNDDQERVYQNCKFHLSHYSEYVLSSSVSIFFTLIVIIVLKDFDAADSMSDIKQQTINLYYSCIDSLSFFGIHLFICLFVVLSPTRGLFPY